jgi:hypothetical protein
LPPLLLLAQRLDLLKAVGAQRLDLLKAVGELFFSVGDYLCSLSTSSVRRYSIFFTSVNSSKI